MNFSSEMLLALEPQERMLLQMLYERVSRPPPPPPEWKWWTPGPATELQAFRARKGVPSPRLTAGTPAVAEVPVEVLASSVDRASQAALPAQHQSTQTE